MSQLALERLRETHGEHVVETHTQHGDDTAVVKPESLEPVMRWLRDDASTRFEMLTDLTAVDYYGKQEPRFEVVYHLYSLTRNHRLRVKVRLDEEAPEVATVTGLWKSAYWMEREAFDLYGIQFLGHPDLRRILLYPEFEGHPLRKDYPMEQRQPLIPPRPGREHL